MDRMGNVLCSMDSSIDFPPLNPQPHTKTGSISWVSWRNKIGQKDLWRSPTPVIIAARIASPTVASILQWIRAFKKSYVGRKHSRRRMEQA